VKGLSAGLCLLQGGPVVSPECCRPEPDLCGVSPPRLVLLMENGAGGGGSQWASTAMWFCKGWVCGGGPEGELCAGHCLP